MVSSVTAVRVIRTYLSLLLLSALVAADTFPSVTPSICVSEYLHAHGFDGSIKHANTDEYEEAISIDNKRVVVNPAVVIIPETEVDVALAVNATRSCDLPFSILSGGHSAAGYCLSDGGVTLNIRDGLNRVELLAENSIGGTVRVESGALWRNIYDVTNTTDFLPIGGGCTTVGSGFLLGGGWSFLSRSYGLGSDNVISFRIVLANGTIVTASKDENVDLFWTLGAGGGNIFDK
jgi:FAD/FMN-containing dehydrogenase